MHVASNDPSEDLPLHTDHGLQRNGYLERGLIVAPSLSPVTMEQPVEHRVIT